jgi:alpha-tubulin suppressor-like RCC1 family protein/serine/threonine protein kinase
MEDRIGRDDAWGVAELRGEYDIFGEIGRGGSAVVYRARDRELGRDVAIKVVHPRATSPDDDPVARLAREARTVAQLQHPNIVAVYAVRRLRGGGLALVMQCVPGATLKTHVQRHGPLAPDACERLLRDVGAALAYAHARGVVHRDVKPENIFLDEASGRALLADFGIARSADADSMTMTGTAVGTPFYMSPEQVEGAALDGRSDLYSLGLVAWEALTGRRPWDGESLYNVIYKQKHEELPPVEALRPGVPLRLQYVVERMLQKRPAARWAGAEGLLAQLGHAVLPGDYTQWQRTLRSRVARHRQQEERRAAAEPRPATAGVTAGSATLHFARPDAPTAAPALSDTQAFPAGSPRASGLEHSAPDVPRSTRLSVADLVPRPGVSVALSRLREDETEPPAPSPPIYADVVEPSWTQGAGESRVAPFRRWLVPPRPRVLAGLALVTAAMGSRALTRAPVSLDASDGLRGRHGGGAASATPGQANPSGARRIPLSGHENAAVGGSAYLDGAAQINAPLAPTSGGRSVLALGGRHSCTLGTAGSVHCWGSNDRGQLGDGTLTSRASPGAVVGALTFTSVASGLAHSCATTRLGDVYCWGADTYGQLGDATTVRRTAPVRVAGPGVYTAVATGAAHSCAVTSDGVLRCWGSNAQGQLGDGTRTDRVTPQPVQVPGAVTRVGAGAQHTCAAIKDGRVFCWGANQSGQLGTASRATPARWTSVQSLRPVTALSAGLKHTCAVTDDGAGWCWGGNDFGQLGDGGRTARLAPARVQISLNRRLVGIAAGSAHSCAVDTTGDVWCWGRNAHGAVGDGTSTSRFVPVRLQLPEPAIAVQVGPTHSCALTAQGTALCWGANTTGTVGDGTRVDRLAPTVVRSRPGKTH